MANKKQLVSFEENPKTFDVVKNVSGNMYRLSSFNKRNISLFSITKKINKLLEP